MTSSPRARKDRAAARASLRCNDSLRLLPANLAMTYSYVNPAVAVLLGWLLLGEPLSVWTFVGVGLVLVGVGGVYRTGH